MPAPQDDRHTLYCSFCGKSQYEVSKFIAGPAVFICDECVVLCVETICTGIPEHELDTLEEVVVAERERRTAEKTKLVSSGTP